MRLKQQTVLLDLDGTLVDYASAATREITSVCELLEKQLAPENVAKALRRFDDFLTTYHCEVDTGRTTVAEFRERRLRHALRPWLVPSAELLEAVSELADATAHTTEVFDGVPEALQSLRGAGFLLVIVTNGPSSIQHRKCSRLGLDRLVDVVITSEDARNIKPHPGIFEAAMVQTASSPQQSTMIGDSWHNDIGGALDFGIARAIYIGEPHVARTRLSGLLGSVDSMTSALPLLMERQS